MDILNLLQPSSILSPLLLSAIVGLIILFIPRRVRYLSELIALASTAYMLFVGASMFFGTDPAYHFNTRNEVRRAYVSGLLYKAEQHKLFALRRERTAGEVQLVRHECTAQETVAVLTDLEFRLEELGCLLAAKAFELIGQVPENGDVASRGTQWLQSLQRPLTIAASPHAR